MGDKSVVVGEYATLAAAAMHQGLLEVAGIPAGLENETAGSVLGGYGPAIGGIRLRVRAEDVERAEAILGEGAAEPWVGEVFGDKEQERWTCPNCGTAVEGDLAICWSCGSDREGHRDASFEPASTPTDGIAPEDGDEDEIGAPAATAPSPAAAADLEADEDISASDQRALRALHQAVFGFFLFPLLLHLYSLYTLAAIDEQDDGPLSERGRRHRAWAVVCDLIGLVEALFVVAWVLRVVRHAP